MKQKRNDVKCHLLSVDNPRVKTLFTKNGMKQNGNEMITEEKQSNVQHPLSVNNPIVKRLFNKTGM